MIKNNRIILFILLCFPARLLLAYIAKQLDETSRNKNIQNIKSKYINLIFNLFTLIIGISFINNWINDKDIGFFGGEAWWHNLRLVHGINYITYSILSIYGINNSYKILVFDAFIGLLSFILHYFV